MANSQKQVGFSKTGGVAFRRPRAGGRPTGTPPQRPGRPLSSWDEEGQAGDYRVDALSREWLLDLKVLGRSARTVEWYGQKMDFYQRHGGAKTLAGLTGFEVKRFIAARQEEGRAENTVHGDFEILKAFANWADREGYPVDPSVIRMRAPKVSQREMTTYTAGDLDRLMEAASAGWPRLAIQVLLGTGMRVGELCNLELTDFEDDGEAAFLKVQRGKGAKFRRVPVSQRLRRELVRYVNRVRPDSRSDKILLRSDGGEVRVATVTDLFQRLRHRLGFQVHAHKFRHTFATEYLRAGGEIERLRRILGHSTYVMVMRYVHLDKGDLAVDFDQRTPY